MYVCMSTMSELSLSYFSVSLGLLKVSCSLSLVEQGVQVWQQGVSHAQGASGRRGNIVPQVQLLWSGSQSIVVTAKTWYIRTQAYVRCVFVYILRVSDLTERKGRKLPLRSSASRALRWCRRWTHIHRRPPSARRRERSPSPRWSTTSDHSTSHHYLNTHMYTYIHT